MEILLFVFFLLVFIGMLVGGYVVKSIKKYKKAAQQAADKREQQSRGEVGRQRQQYSQRQQPKKAQTAQSAQNTQTNQSTQNTQSTQAAPEQENARHTQTATGETIIDHHHQKRENRKIFDDEDGEYVEFEEA